MLTIRDDQMQAFERQSVERFEEEMIEDVRETYPEACSGMSKDDIRATVHYGVEVAASYGITAEVLVADYIHVMFLEGIDFDQDPRYPWAQEILEDESLSEVEAMELLVDQVEAEELKAGGHRP